jgi:hypothetical protein
MRGPPSCPDHTLATRHTERRWGSRIGLRIRGGRDDAQGWQDTRLARDAPVGYRRVAWDDAQDW